MQFPPLKQSRPWRIIASEVAHERDSVKLAGLVEELNRALAEQGIEPAAKAIRNRSPPDFPLCEYGEINFNPSYCRNVTTLLDHVRYTC